MFPMSALQQQQLLTVHTMTRAGHTPAQPESFSTNSRRGSTECWPQQCTLAQDQAPYCYESTNIPCFQLTFSFYSACFSHGYFMQKELQMFTISGLWEWFIAMMPWRHLRHSRHWHRLLHCSARSGCCQQPKEPLLIFVLKECTW